MILRVLLVVVLGSSGATLAQAPAGEPDRDPRILVQTDLRVEHPSAVRGAIEAVLVSRTASWNAANLVGFCEAYAEDAVLLMANGVTRGRRAVLERYELAGQAADHHDHRRRCARRGDAARERAAAVQAGVHQGGLPPARSGRSRLSATESATA